MTRNAALKTSQTDPARRGSAFARLWAATGASTLADGILLTALPLLATKVTQDPIEISIVASIGWLPWLLIGPLAGAAVDRWDRRRILIFSAAARVAGALILTTAVALDQVGVPLLLVVGFWLGCGRTLFDSSTQAIIPDLVSRAPAALHRANSRLVGTQTVNEQFAGGPIGGILYAISAAIPFACDALLYAIGSLLASRIPRRPRRPNASTDKTFPTTLRADMSEGIKYLVGDPLLRALAITAATVNLAFMAGWGILVLFTRARLGLGSVGFGLLTIPTALGGLLASIVAVRLSQRLGSGTILISALSALSLGQLVLGLATTPWLAGLALGLSGAGVVLYDILAQSLRQSTVPDRLLGRVIATSRLVSLGAVPVGGLLGGLLAHYLGLQSPFLLGAAVLALTAILASRKITNKAFTHGVPDHEPTGSS